MNSNTSGVYTLFFSYLFKVEEFSYGKLTGVSLCIFGVILISLQDKKATNNEVEHSVIGDIFALLGAIFYGLFSTILKLKVDIMILLLHLQLHILFSRSFYSRYKRMGMYRLN